MTRLVYSFMLVIFLKTLSFFESENSAKVEILSDWDGVSKRFHLGVKFSISPGWYIYWQNPGDAGLPPEINLELPPYLEAESVKFPLPEKIVHGEIISYGYYKEVVLLIPIKIKSIDELKKQNLIKLRVNWLVCRESCIPGSASVEYRLKKASSDERLLIDKYKERIPKEFNASGLEVRDFKVESKGNLNLVKIEFSGNRAKQITDFYPDAVENFLIDFKSIRIKNGVVELSATLTKPGEKMNFLSGVVVVNNEGYNLKLNLSQKQK